LRLDTETQRALNDTIEEIRIALQENPNNPDKVRGGVPYPRDKHQTWKRRVGRPGSNIGKRGGLRLCYWWRRNEREIVLLFLYDKREKADLMQREIDKAKAAFPRPPSSSSST